MKDPIQKVLRRKEKIEKIKLLWIRIPIWLAIIAYGSLGCFADSRYRDMWLTVGILLALLLIIYISVKQAKLNLALIEKINAIEEKISPSSIAHHPPRTESKAPQK